MVEIQRKQSIKLSKQDELELGRIIQQGSMAREKLENSDEVNPDEKTSLKRKVRAGENAISDLCAANINLVVSIAQSYRENYPYSPPLEDCVQYGLEGLTIAARKYDPNQKNKFSTMAFLWVKQSITRGVNAGGKLVRLPENRVEQYSKIANMERKLISENKSISQDQIDSAVLKKFPRLDKEHLYKIKNAASSYTSLNRTVDDSDDGGSELMDIISQTSYDFSAEQEAVNSDMQDKLDSAMLVLSPVQCDAVSSFFEVSINGSSIITDREVREKHSLKSVAEYKEHLQEGLIALRKELNQRGLTMSDFI